MGFKLAGSAVALPLKILYVGNMILMGVNIMMVNFSIVLNSLVEPDPLPVR